MPPTGIVLRRIAGTCKWRPAFVLSHCGQIEPSSFLPQGIGVRVDFR
jgi:hypothetical protein